MITHVFVQNAGTIGTPATYNDPSAVADDVIAAFNLAGAGIDISGANTAKYSLAIGDDNRPFLTAPIDPATVLVDKQVYVAPVKQSTAVLIPVGPSGGANYNIKVSVVRDLVGGKTVPLDSALPHVVTNFEVAVPASQADEPTIDSFMALINAVGITRSFTGRSNKVNTVTMTLNNVTRGSISEFFAKRGKKDTMDHGVQPAQKGRNQAEIEAGVNKRLKAGYKHGGGVHRVRLHKSASRRAVGTTRSAKGGLAKYAGGGAVKKVGAAPSRR